MYKLTSGTSIIRQSDGASIPPDPANKDYAEYLVWFDQGNVPLPADHPTPEQLFAAIEQAIEQKIHDVAVQGGWMNHDRCMLRASYPNPWQAKALAYSTWVDNCWLHTLTERDKIIAGTRTNIPTPAEAVLELPAMVWPV